MNKYKTKKILKILIGLVMLGNLISCASESEPSVKIIHPPKVKTTIVAVSPEVNASKRSKEFVITNNLRDRLSFEVGDSSHEQSVEYVQLKVSCGNFVKQTEHRVQDSPTIFDVMPKEIFLSKLEDRKLGCKFETRFKFVRFSEQKYEKSYIFHDPVPLSLQDFEGRPGVKKGKLELWRTVLDNEKYFFDSIGFFQDLEKNKYFNRADFEVSVLCESKYFEMASIDFRKAAGLDYELQSWIQSEFDQKTNIRCRIFYRKNEGKILKQGALVEIFRKPKVDISVDVSESVKYKYKLDGAGLAPVFQVNIRNSSKKSIVYLLKMDQVRGQLQGGGVSLNNVKLIGLKELNTTVPFNEGYYYIRLDVGQTITISAQFDYFTHGSGSIPFGHSANHKIDFSQALYVQMGLGKVVKYASQGESIGLSVDASYGSPSVAIF